MPLNESNLASKIEAAFKSASDIGCTDEEDVAQKAQDARKKIAEDIAKAIIAEIKNIKITYSSGLATASGGGPVLGTFGYTIS